MTEEETEEIDSKVMKFMKEASVHGYFEHTVREVSKGAKITYNDAIKCLERLVTKKLVDYRERGTTKRKTPFYYLVEVRELCKKAWG
jgi:nitric oxide synthase oxygenase domain/subunit